MNEYRKGRHTLLDPVPFPGSSSKCGLRNPSSICRNAPAGSSDRSEKRCLTAAVALATLDGSLLPPAVLLLAFVVPDVGYGAGSVLPTGEGILLGDLRTDGGRSR